MKHILGLYIIFALFSSCSAQNKQQVLNANQFEQAITNNQVQLLDVRTAEEYKGGHIAHALQADWTNKDEFKDRVQALDKAKPLYVYCASGVRSEAAANWLRSQGFNEVYNLESGLISWKKAGKPLEGAKEVKQMSREEYNALIQQGVVLVDFGAEWCPPCKKMEPVLQSLSKELEGRFTLAQIDAGAQTTLMQKMNVDKLPTFILYKDGQETWRYTGLIDKASLQDKIQSLQ